MKKIKDNLLEHKRLYIGLSVLAFMAIICAILKFVFYCISDVRDDIPFADIGDLFIIISYFITFFLAILLAGSIIWLIATKLGIKIHICWYIIAINTLITVTSIYYIIDDLFMSQSWLQGLGAFIFGFFVIPVNLVVYIFCIIMIKAHKKKPNDEKK